MESVALACLLRSLITHVISSITLLGQTRIGIMICLAHQERVDEVIVVVVAMGKTLPQMQLVVARLVGYPGRVRGGLVPPT